MITYAKQTKMKFSKKDKPGHIELISENQPGITEEIELDSVSMETEPLISCSSSLGLLIGKSEAVSAIFEREGERKGKRSHSM